jgi:heme-degrading monooxygenase HmoA
MFTVIAILWEFVVPEEKRREFERHYSAAGAWAQFFGACKAYRGTTLLAGADGRYITCDHWDTREAYEEFRRANAEEYAALDRRFEALTASEQRLGIFEMK